MAADKKIEEGRKLIDALKIGTKTSKEEYEDAKAKADEIIEGLRKKYGKTDAFKNLEQYYEDTLEKSAYARTVFCGTLETTFATATEARDFEQLFENADRSIGDATLDSFEPIDLGRFTKLFRQSLNNPGFYEVFNAKMESLHESLVFQFIDREIGNMQDDAKFDEIIDKLAAKFAKYDGDVKRMKEDLKKEQDNKQTEQVNKAIIVRIRDDANTAIEKIREELEKSTESAKMLLDEAKANYAKNVNENFKIDVNNPNWEGVDPFVKLICEEINNNFATVETSIKDKASANTSSSVQNQLEEIRKRVEEIYVQAKKQIGQIKGCTKADKNIKLEYLNNAIKEMDSEIAKLVKLEKDNPDFKRLIGAVATPSTQRLGAVKGWAEKLGEELGIKPIEETAEHSM